MQHNLPVGMRAWNGALTTLVEANMRVYRWVSMEHAGRRLVSAKLTELFGAGDGVHASVLHSSIPAWMTVLSTMANADPPIVLRVRTEVVSVVEFSVLAISFGDTTACLLRLWFCSSRRPYICGLVSG